MIRLHGVTKHYGDVVAVEALTLEVRRGELLALVGASGCGKTTTLKMINRLVEPSAGRVEVDGLDTRTLPAHELRRRIGYGFQQVGLFPHMSVARNVGVVPSLLGWEARRIEQRVDELLELVRLEPSEFRARRPEELSGGQAQRVGLARALAAAPDVVLLDEPFGALDPATRDHLQQEVDAIRRALDLTIVLVTHDMTEALLLGDRIAVMHAGRLVQHDEARALLDDPAHACVSDLLETPRRQARALAGRFGDATDNDGSAA